MPVSQGTIAERTYYKSKEQPRCSCKKKRNQVVFPGPSPYPAEQVKKDQGSMEEHKEHIEEVIDHFLFLIVNNWEVRFLDSTHFMGSIIDNETFPLIFRQEICWDKIKRRYMWQHMKAWL
jgi:hypothetical protein